MNHRGLLIYSYRGQGIFAFTLQEKLEHRPEHDNEVIKKLESAISALLGCSEEIESEQVKLKSSKSKRSKDGEQSGKKTRKRNSSGESDCSSGGEHYVRQRCGNSIPHCKRMQDTHFHLNTFDSSDAHFLFQTIIR